MINLDERYLSYLQTDKKFSIDGTNESVINYGWHCDGNEIKGHYVTTNNHKLYYNTVSYTHPPSPRDATLSRMPSSA